MDSSSGRRARLEYSLGHGVYLLVVAVLLGAAVPFLFNSYVVGSVIFLFLIYVVLAISYDILGGLASYMNLGHVVFFGIGAYVAAVAFKKLSVPLLLGIGAAPLLVAAFALLFSYPLFRLRGFYFAVAGLAFVELANLVVASVDAKPLTNGFNGISFVQYDVATPYYAALILAAFAILFTRLVSRSRLGLALRSIREDEDVAESIGIDVTRTKRVTLVMSGAIAGLGGAIYFWERGAIDPQTAFGFGIVFIPVTLALLGGTGTIVGPVIGAAIYVYLQNYGITFLESIVPGMSQFPNATLGVILISVGLFAPRGIAGSGWVRSAALRLFLELTR